MKKADKPGDKVPSKGEVVFSGSGSTSCNSSVTAESCSYTDNNQQVHCIFPFIGENPGQKSGQLYSLSLSRLSLVLQEDRHMTAV